MAVGHIALDEQEYRIVWTNYQKGTDNPFAAKLGQGAGKYDDLEGYSATVQDDWRGGIAKVEADAGGTYASTLDTRFRNRILLPAKSELVPPSNYPSSHNENTPTFYAAIGGAEYAQSISQFFAFELKSTSSATKISIFLKALITGRDTAENTRWQVRPKSGSSPAASASARNGWVEFYAQDEQPEGEHWHRLYEDSATGISTGDVVVIENQGPPIFIPLFDSPGEDVWVTTDGEGIWSRTADFSPSYDYFTEDNFTYPMWFNGEVHFMNNLGTLTTLVGTAGQYYFGGSGSSGHFFPVDVVTFRDELWMARGAAGTRILDDTYGTRADVAAWDANILIRWNGFVYRAYERNLYYTAEGNTWSGPYEVGNVGEIRGMAGEGDGNNILVSTDDGLFVFAEGDTSYGVTPWPTISPNNGREMLHHQGSVYIVVDDNRIVRYNAGSLLDIWLKDDDDKPLIAQGKIESLASMGGILYAAVSGKENDYGAVFGWNSEGWHYISSLPQGSANAKLLADRETSSLWVGTSSDADAPDGHSPMRIPVSANGLPITDDDYYFASGGWVETDWIHGGLVDLDKDWHSVYLDLDNYDSTNQDIDVYYQDGDDSGWKPLIRDTSVTDEQEIVWDSANRPATKKIKLAFLVRSTNGTSPVIRAIRLKYQINVNDRWRWQLPIELAEEQVMLDGTRNDRTVEEMLTHVEGVIASVAPVTFRDVDGTTYSIRVKSANQSLEKYEDIEYVPAGEEIQYNTIYYLSIAET